MNTRTIARGLCALLGVLCLQAGAQTFEASFAVHLVGDGRRIVVRNKTCNTCPDPAFVVESADGTPVGEMKARERQVIISKATTPNGRYFITSTSVGESVIRVYDLQRLQVIKQFRDTQEAKGYSRLSVSPDGRILSVMSQWNQYDPGGGGSSLRLYDLTALPAKLPLLADLSDAGMKRGPFQHAVGNAEIATMTEPVPPRYGPDRWVEYHLYGQDGRQFKAGLRLDQLLVNSWQTIGGRLILGFSEPRTNQRASTKVAHFAALLVDVDLQTGMASIGRLADYDHGPEWGQVTEFDGQPLCVAYAGFMVLSGANCSARTRRELTDLPIRLQLKQRADGYWLLDQAMILQAVFGPDWQKR